MYKHKFILDEKDHYPQVRMFYDNNFKLYVETGDAYPRNATLPGFHLAAALFGKAIGCCSPDIIRIFNMLTGVLIALVAFLIAREMSGRNMAAIRALQVFFLPVLFPFHFLIYTDSFSLLMVLVSFFTCLKRKYLLSALFAIAAVFVRQTNICFIIILMSYHYVNEHGFSFNLPGLKKQFYPVWPYLLACAAFAIHILMYGRVSLNNDHAITLSEGNLLFSLFCCFLIFLPMHLWNRKSIQAWTLANQRWMIPVVLLVAISCLLYNPSHRFNRIPWLFRNEVLDYLTRDIPGRVILICSVIGAVLSLASAKYLGRGAYLLFLLWPLLLVGMLLVEPRYYIIPFTFLILFRKPESIYMELILLSWLVLAGWIIYCVHVNTIFII
ncbi:MAG: hypothetical protein WAX69_05810 [Victivallales bacterium]